MCLNPRKIRVRNRQLGRNNYNPLYITVPCGECAECRELKMNQWYLRNYWHSKECFDKGGYVLFDTLTYDDRHLPHLSDFFEDLQGTEDDFACFSYDDYKNFMKRLRTNLSRGVFEPEYQEVKELIRKRKRCKRGSEEFNRLNIEIEGCRMALKRWQAAKNLTAFIVCEYGSEGYYKDDHGKMRKATFRPHYHMLFYVNIPGLDAVRLSKYIYNSWQKGRTDCCDLDGLPRSSYIRYHNAIGLGYRDKDVDLRKVSAYVAKYINKDADYSAKIKARVSDICTRLFYEYEIYDSKVQDKFRHSVERIVDGFHHQGNGFGLYGIAPENLDEDMIIERGVCAMPDTKKIVKYVPVPMYYIRHLYYNLHRSAVCDSPVYVLKKEGIKYKESCLRRRFKNLTDELTKLYLNMEDKDKFEVDCLLEDRTIEDLAKYLIFYQGRIVPEDGIDLNIDHVIKQIVRYHPFKRNYWFRDQDGDIFAPMFGCFQEWKYVDFDKFEKKYCINQWSMPSSGTIRP